MPTNPETSQSLFNNVPENSTVNFNREVYQAHTMDIHYHGVTSNQPIELTEEQKSFIISSIKTHYAEKAKIQRLFSDEAQEIDSCYVNLAIVREQEQKKREKAALRAQQEKEKEEQQAKELVGGRLSSYEDLYTPQIPIKLEEIFDKLKDEKEAKEYKRLLVVGRAGIGKTTLCKHIVHRWINAPADNPLWSNKPFKFVFWITLREVAVLKPKPKEVAEVVYYQCIPEAEQEHISLEQFKLFYAAIEKDALYLADGLDEVLQVIAKQNALGRCLRALLEKPNLVLTSRPISATTIKKPFDRRLENIGFTDENIEQFIRRYFNDKHAHADMLIKALKANPSIWGTAHVPINLELICNAWEDEDPSQVEVPEQVTMTSLYESVIVKLQYRYLKRLEALNQLLPDEKQRNFSIRFIRQHKQCKPVMDVLKEFAFLGMQTDELLLSGELLLELLENYYPDNQAAQDQLIERLHEMHLLQSTDRKLWVNKQSFYFAHLTFQEYLAAEYIAESLLAGKSLSLPDNKSQTAAEYIAANKYHPRLEIMWWFVAGILHNRGHIDKLDLYFTLLNELPVDIVGFRHIQLLTRCLDEAQCNNQIKLKETILEELKQWIEAVFGWKKENRLIPNSSKEALARTLRLSAGVLGAKGLEGWLLGQVGSNKDAIASTLLQIKSSWSWVINEKLIGWLEDDDVDSDVQADLAQGLIGSLEVLGEAQRGKVIDAALMLLSDDSVDGDVRTDLAERLFEMIDELKEMQQDKFIEGVCALLSDNNMDGAARADLAQRLIRALTTLKEEQKDTLIKESLALNIDDIEASYIQADLALGVIGKLADLKEAQQDKIIKGALALLSDDSMDNDAQTYLAEQLFEMLDELEKVQRNKFIEGVNALLRGGNVVNYVRKALLQGLYGTPPETEEIPQNENMYADFEMQAKYEEAQQSKDIDVTLTIPNDAEESIYMMVLTVKELVGRLPEFEEDQQSKIIDLTLTLLSKANAYLSAHANLVQDLFGTLAKFGEAKQNKVIKWAIALLSNSSVANDVRAVLTKGLMGTLANLEEVQQGKVIEEAMKLLSSGVAGNMLAALAKGLMEALVNLKEVQQSKIIEEIMKLLSNGNEAGDVRAALAKGLMKTLENFKEAQQSSFIEEIMKLLSDSNLDNYVHADLVRRLIGTLANLEEVQQSKIIEEVMALLSNGNVADGVRAALAQGLMEALVNLKELQQGKIIEKALMLLNNVSIDGGMRLTLVQGLIGISTRLREVQQDEFIRGAFALFKDTNRQSDLAQGLVRMLAKFGEAQQGKVIEGILALLNDSSVSGDVRATLAQGIMGLLANLGEEQDKVIDVALALISDASVGDYKRAALAQGLMAGLRVEKQLSLSSKLLSVLICEDNWQVRNAIESALTNINMKSCLVVNPNAYIIVYNALQANAVIMPNIKHKFFNLNSYAGSTRCKQVIAKDDVGWQAYLQQSQQTLVDIIGFVPVTMQQVLSAANISDSRLQRRSNDEIALYLNPTYSRVKQKQEKNNASTNHFFARQQKQLMTIANTQPKETKQVENLSAEVVASSHNISDTDGSYEELGMGKVCGVM